MKETNILKVFEKNKYSDATRVRIIILQYLREKEILTGFEKEGYVDKISERRIFEQVFRKDEKDKK